MKVLHTVMSISRKAGGLQGAVMSLSRALSAGGGAAVEVFGLADEFSSADAPMWDPMKPRALRTLGPSAFGYAPRMLGEMVAAKADVVHCHGLWLYPSLAALRWKHRTHGPYVVSPHGMLERHVEMRKSRIKKAAALGLFEGRHLREASCLHALCEAEYQDIRAMGLTNPVCVIPNGVDPPPLQLDSAAPWRGEPGDDRKVLLYLGRVARKKGLIELIQAMSLIARRGPSLLERWRLVVVGWEKDNHRAELEKLSSDLGLGSLVALQGPLFGAAKDAAYRHARAFVLPSSSEGLPLVIPEAWSYALPVVMTPQCNVPEGVAAGAAICSSPDADALAEALAILFQMPDQELAAMGDRGRRLTAERFAWPKIGSQMSAVYEWVTRGGARPDTVRLQ